MKSTKLSLIIAFLFFSVVLVSCGGGETATETAEETENADTTPEEGDTSEEAPADEADEAPADEAKAIVDLAVGTPDLSTLVEALQAAELVEALSGEGPFTVFAPTNAAFEALGETLTELMEAEDKTALANILKYHVVSGKVMSTDLSDGMEAETLNGAKIKIAISDEGVKLNDAASVATADVDATNGVVHIIDAVILPPTE